MASILFPEVDVEVVKITLTKKDNSGTTTLYFGLDYWASGRLYTTNPEVLPLLVSSPTVRRGVGIYAGIKYDVSVDLYAKTAMTEAGKSFSDLLDVYEIQNADVQVLYYSKPIGDVTTHSDSVNIRQTLKVIEVRYSDDGATASLRCRDVFFKDKEVSKRLDVGTTTLAGYEHNGKLLGQYGAIVFGASTDTSAGIIIDAPWISARRFYLPGPAQYYPVMSLFSGFVFTNHPNKAFIQLYGRNQHKKVDDTEWLKLDIPADANVAYDGNSSIVGGVTTSMQTYWRGVANSPPHGKAIIVNAMTIYMLELGTVAAGDGNAFIEISFAETTGGALPWAPVGSVLRSAKIDGTNTVFDAGGALTTFEFSPPIVMNNAEAYFIKVGWSNTDDAANAIQTKVVADASYAHFYQSKAENETAWQTGSAVRLPIEIFALGGSWSDGAGSVFSTYGMHGKSGPYHSSTGTGTEMQNINRSVEFKIGISGIADNGSGTYTGSANAVIENPSDIVRFTLMNADFGLGLSSTYVNTSTLDSVRSSLSSLGLKLKIVIDRETTAEELINEICRQSRIVYYKTKDGKVALYYPVPINNTFTARLSQAVLGGEMQIESIRDADYSTVVNEFKQSYQPDELNQPKDVDVLPRAERDKLAGILEITPTSSTNSDTFRQNLCSVSQAKYGKREMTFPLSFYDAATDAQKIQNYYCDRFSTLQKRAILRLPRRTYFNTLDLFSTIQAHHVGISAYDGTALPGKQHYQGTPIVTYSENIPSVVWAGGVFEGQVYEVEEEGPWFTITAETISVF